MLRCSVFSGYRPIALAGATLTALLAWPAPGFSREYPAPYDAAGQIAVLDELIETTAGRYRLYAADLFEEQHRYAPRANSTMLSDVRFLYRPVSDPAFAAERKLLARRLRQSDTGTGVLWQTNNDLRRNRQNADAANAGQPGGPEFERSLFVHTSFEVPGRQSYRLEVSEPIVLEGQLYRASVWVHSRMYRHTISLLFRSANGHEVRVPLGPLLWRGWRRLDVALPPELFQRGRQIGRRYRHEFVGFLIKSHPKAQPGDVALLFDNLLVLSDVRELSYPGAELNF